MSVDVDVVPALTGAELVSWSVGDVAAAPCVAEDVCVVELPVVWVGDDPFVETLEILEVAV